MENKKKSEDNELIDKLYEVYKDLQKKQEEKDKKKLKELLTREVTYVPSPLFPKLRQTKWRGVHRCSVRRLSVR